MNLGDKMTREFVRLPEFEKQCKRIGLDEDDVIEIESALLYNPSLGDVMRGTGGIRKLRVSMPDRVRAAESELFTLISPCSTRFTC